MVLTPQGRADAARIWLVGGPTAGGKSDLALRLARAIGGEIVNADSMQIYADLRGLTARPSEHQAAIAPHHLFGVADGGDAWSVGRWLRAATQTLGEIASRGRPAIVVGGTGLYFKALTTGISDIPPTRVGIRDQIQTLYDQAGEAAFRETLARVDPIAAGRIARADRQRLTRAYEVWLASGRSLTSWQTGATPLIPERAWRGLVIEPPRSVLYDRCDARLGRMVRAGALDEVAALVSRRLDPAAPIMKALGVPPFAAHLRGELSLAEALDRARQDTRRYAKRQLTWFRNQTPDWPRFEDTETALAFATS